MLPVSSCNNLAALEMRRIDVKLPSTCIDCGGTMTAGFIVDSAHGMEVVSTWQEGEPVKKWWTMGGITRAGAPRLEVTTLRCERCGLLKEYAIKA